MAGGFISDAARNLIVECEVSSEAAYNKRYRNPVWPGGRSGVTIGIGYDIGAGVKDETQLRLDWGGKIPGYMIDALVPCIGVTGDAARNLLPSVRTRVDVPWSAAIAVFDQVDVPRWYKTCKNALPNFDKLSPDSRGALLSLAYNRGPSFQRIGERYAEMRAIRDHMIAGNHHLIPGEIRSMKRLWPNQSERGLPIRREAEAVLFEKGLKKPAMPPVFTPPDVPKIDPAKPTGLAAFFSAIAAIFRGK